MDSNGYTTYYYANGDSLLVPIGHQKEVYLRKGLFLTPPALEVPKNAKRKKEGDSAAKSI